MTDNVSILWVSVTLVLVALKLDGIVDWPWLLVLSPIPVVAVVAALASAAEYFNSNNFH